MSDTSPFGFGRFVPGFDFLQNLAKGAAAGMPAMPGMSMPTGWIAPTMSVEDIDKRIQELKSVQFWLDQNSRALTATVQALEVQKMTLATLQGMNTAMGDLAGAFGAARATPDDASAAAAPSSAASPEPQAAQAQAASAIPGMADPMQWWGALTSQFQQIAANAIKDVSAHQAAFEATREMASGAVKTATDMAAQAAAQGMQTAQDLQSAAAAAVSAQAAPAGQPAGKAQPAARKAAAKTGAAGAAAPDASASRPAAAKTTASARTRRPAG